MILTTIIARVADGLPLVASMQEDEQLGRSLSEYQKQAKLLFSKMNQQSPPRLSIATEPYIFHYIIEDGVCFLALCEKTFKMGLAFQYLEDIQQEFSSKYGRRVSAVSRPYPFIEFDTYLQKAKKTYIDSRQRRQLTGIKNELQDVQRIMVQNIDDVMQRGVALSDLDVKATNLVFNSEKYKRDAKNLNLRSRNAKIAAATSIIVTFLIYLRYWWFI
ncbi:vesicle-trafficking protein SEC22b-like [Anneissia japonica]|uniref:vesicle-trafficking protein SEC22b-like n=1 Tax=Anneissia japonica TaxID=1529436 RepID=UPI001425A6AB|nr:vesicle-trafficking protein SEC22b-like [Anneissia japonica]